VEFTPSSAPGGGRPHSDRQHWQALSAAASRDLPPGRIGGVIAQLRQRGRVASRRASVFLGFLLGTVLFGLAYYIGLPLLAAYAEGTARTWRDQVYAAEADNAALDVRRAATVASLTDALALYPEVTRKATKEGFWTPSTLPDGTLIATGRFGTILRSIDNGMTWQEVNGRKLWPEEGNTGDFFTSHVLPSGTLIATGPGGTILRSIDSGARWLQVRTGSDLNKPSSSPLALSDGTLITTWQNGAILRSTDDGVSWVQVRGEKTIEGLSSPVALADDTVIATGYRGTILRSTDKGVTWLEVYGVPGRAEGFYPPLVLADGILIATGGFGTILRSHDHGVAWSEVRARFVQVEGFSTPLVLANGTLVSMGHAGTILRSTDEGSTWREARPRSDTGEQFSTPLTLTDDVLIATGYSGTILRSTDHGATWGVVRARSDTGEGFFDPVALADGTLIATGTLGTIQRSTDQGATWLEMRAATANGEGLFTPLALADGSVIVTGGLGTILRLSGDMSGEFRKRAADLPPGGAGDPRLSDLVDGLDPAIREADAVAAEVGALGRITAERVSVEAQLRLAQDNLAKWTSGEAADEVRRAAFATFMEDCRKGAAEPRDAALTTACLDAYAANQAAAERKWWESLAEKVPPGILLLFLLATLSGLYRYNVRLAGFHDGRADALELMVAKVDKDLLIVVSDALAADKVEFGSAKTPADHAAEMATALLNRAKP
jgi:photosystem II stability/assembly factor-like uncharacterized protein